MQIKIYDRNNPMMFWEDLMGNKPFAEVYASAWAGEEPYQFKVEVIDTAGQKHPPQPLRQVLASIRADYITFLQKEGFSPQHIIKDLGVTRQRYYQILNKFGLDKHERVPRQAIVSFLKEGKSIENIIGHFKHVSSEVILDIEKKLELELAHKQLQLRKEHFSIFFWSHYTNKQIQEKLNISEGSGRGYASRLDTPFKGRNAEYVNRLLLAGVPIKEVSKRRGVSCATVLQNLDFYKNAADRYSREIPRTLNLLKLKARFNTFEYVDSAILALHEDPAHYTDLFHGPPIRVSIEGEHCKLHCSSKYIERLEENGIHYIPVWYEENAFKLTRYLETFK